MTAPKPQGDYCNLPCDHDYCRKVWAEHAENARKFGHREYAYVVKMPTRKLIYLCFNFCCYAARLSYQSTPKYIAGLIARETGYRVYGGQGGFPIKWSWRHRLEDAYKADVEPIVESTQSRYYFERDVARAVTQYKAEVVRCGVCHRYRLPYTLRTLVDNRWRATQQGWSAVWEGERHQDCDDLLIWRFRISGGARMSDALEDAAIKLHELEREIQSSRYKFNEARDNYYACKRREERAKLQQTRDALLQETKRLMSLEKRLTRILMLNYRANKAREEKKWRRLKENQQLLRGIKKALRQGQPQDALQSLRQEFTRTANSRRS